MTINEAYLVALKTIVISTYIPEMNPGLYDTFPESFPVYKGCQEKNVTCSKFKRVITQKLYVLGGCPSHSLESS